SPGFSIPPGPPPSGISAHTPIAARRGHRRARPIGTSSPSSTPRASVGDDRTVEISNVRKVSWPRDGYTKGDLLAYYDSVAPLMLPYLQDRPLVLTRYPDGIGGKSF